jgi:TfoX/Sxy family transcriptional regulator of competence genes
LTRKRNYGAFYKNYDAFLKQLNKTLGLRETNRVAPESEDKIEWETDDKKKISVTKREYWNLERNRWLDKHCHRKKVRAYYDAWAKVSTLTKRRLDDINSQI